MKKFFIAICAFIFSSNTFSNCTVEQDAAVIEMNVLVEEEGGVSAGEHVAMDLVKVEVPVSVSGIPLVAMFLTEGELASFWIPISFKVEKEKAVFQFPAYLESIQNFEVLAQYESGNCIKSVQRLLG